MSEQQSTDAWAQVRKIHRDYKTFYQGSGRLLLVVFGILVVKAIFQNDGDFIKNLSMETLSIAATVLVLDWLAERRAERRADERRQQREIEEAKEQLVMEARSQSNETAKNAIETLRYKGWLRGENGLLKYGKLENAHWYGVRLRKANLEGANLRNANLQGAELTLSNMKNTISRRINLRDALLTSTKLQAADLKDAELQDAKLFEAEFSEETILPDASFWTPDTDLTRFTDPKHPHFWRSDDKRSPAYHGKSGDVSDNPTTNNE
jgi:hypothetical protein